MPGNSYSAIRADGKPFQAPTKKMELGTLVHTYLLTPRDYNYEKVEIVRPLAAAVKARLGILLNYCQPELAVTADFCHEGFAMAYKGRIDLAIPNRLVLDIKVSEMPLQKGVEFFRYDLQLAGYALAIGAKVAMIISIHPKKPEQISIYNVAITKEWWEHQIKIKGEVIC